MTYRLLFAGLSEPEARRLEAMADPLGLAITNESLSKAVDRARQDKPHLVVLDVSDSAMAMEVLGHLKTHAKTRDMQVVVLAAREDSEERDIALDLGAAGYITKPITPDFLAKLSAFLSGQGD
ncbi:MAG: response regulator [Myxococcaceae bacterium]|nr:response regulator [Myxococcaceae bacterium]